MPDGFIGSREKIKIRPIRFVAGAPSPRLLTRPAGNMHHFITASLRRGMRRGQSAFVDFTSWLSPVHKTAEECALACTGSTVHELSRSNTEVCIDRGAVQHQRLCSDVTCWLKRPSELNHHFCTSKRRGPCRFMQLFSGSQPWMLGSWDHPPKRLAACLPTGCMHLGGVRRARRAERKKRKKKRRAYLQAEVVISHRNTTAGP